jgi:signal transduction histidine kinase
LIGIILLLNKRRTAKDLLNKRQINIMLLATSIVLVVNIISGIVLLRIIKSDSVGLLFGNFALLISSILLGYAIVRHKMFDVRALVARSFAYIFTIGLIGIVTTAVLFYLSAILESAGANATTLRFVYVVITMILGLSFIPVKKFFDRISNRLFYRDAYETKELIDEFNKTIVETIDLEKLLDSSAGVIEKYLKPEFVAFLLVQKDGSVRLIHAKNTDVTDQLAEQVRGYVKSSTQKTYLADMLDVGDADLKLLLQQESIGVVIRVTKNANEEGIGYILMGYKKSGSIYNSQDEGAMETIANELAIAIENALQYEEIQNFAKTLEEKVEVATKDLRKANEKLKELDQTKDDFISMASHQLRTPLTSVEGYVSMVLEGDVGKVSKKQEQLLNQAFVSSQRMVYLIADLLNVSRLKTGKFIIEAKETNLADVIEGEISQLTETAKGRDLEVTYKKPKNFPELMLDETKIRQVIMNFADNAIYYTPSGGHINIVLEDKDETIEFRVEDDGIGVPKTEQHHLFNKFYRAGNAKKARPDGTGLGLFMAKKVVVAQGGAIIFRSAEGKGSTFGFSFAKKPLLPKNYKGLVAKESVVEKPKKTTKKR